MRERRGEDATSCATTSSLWFLVLAKPSLDAPRYERQCVVLDMNPGLGTPSPGWRLQVVGDATDEADLHNAGIERAAALSRRQIRTRQPCLVLTARAVRHDLRIVSRSTRQVGCPASSMRDGCGAIAYDSYGASLASSRFVGRVGSHDLPLLGLGTEEIIVDASSSLVGKTIPQLIDEHRACTFGIAYRIRDTYRNESGTRTQRRAPRSTGRRCDYSIAASGIRAHHRGRHSPQLYARRTYPAARNPAAMTRAGPTYGSRQVPQSPPQWPDRKRTGGCPVCAHDIAIFEAPLSVPVERP